MKKRTCSVAGCESAAAARGWCERHYRRALRHGEPTAGGTSHGDGTCSVAGCTRAHYARTWCRLHYERWRKHGDPTHEPIAVAERFWSKVAIGGADECWPWQAARSASGYGKFGTWIASRFAWEQANDRAIPAGMRVLHSCDNPPCCNPAHLSVGTHLLNMQQMASRGRGVVGERHPLATLTERGVVEIRARWGRGETQRSLARRFGVSIGTIADVVYRRAWRHVT